MTLDDMLNISGGKKYTHKELLEEPELLYKMIEQAKKKLSDPLVRREPKEAIVVLFDISGSMQLDFTEGLERLGACKAFFNAFADRTIAYNFPHVISLVFFDSLIEKMCGFTELFV
jgi:hypothetical protein